MTLVSKLKPFPSLNRFLRKWVQGLPAGVQHYEADEKKLMQT
jgi:hypothetical protein